ncbi:MAG: HAD family phosphatase [Ruminococcus sp.]|nr:HAD family phosphatase [Ruminococcus sp.]
MIRGIIFDLDGTLIDSMPVWYEVDRIFLREQGIENPPEDISEKVKKMTIEKSSEFFINTFNLKCDVPYIIKRIEEIVKKEYEENIPLKPYVNELLDFLDSKGLHYGVATVTYKSLAEAVLKRHDIYKRLDFMLTVDEYPLGKKNYDIYKGGADILGLSPENSLVIEDSLHCIQTARAGGFVTAGVYDEMSADDGEEIKITADYYFKNLSEIVSIF